MKTKLTTLALLALTTSVFALSYLLAWDPSDPNDQVAGFNIYEWQTASNMWLKIGGTTNVQTTTTNTYWISNVVAGVHIYTVTATNGSSTNTGGESPFSNAAIPLPKPPMGLKPIK